MNVSFSAGPAIIINLTSIGLLLLLPLLLLPLTTSLPTFFEAATVWLLLYIDLAARALYKLYRMSSNSNMSLKQKQQQQQKQLSATGNRYKKVEGKNNWFMDSEFELSELVRPRFSSSSSPPPARLFGLAKAWYVRTYAWWLLILTPFPLYFCTRAFKSGERK